MNLTGTPFSEQLPAAQLHWIIADRSGCIVVESTEKGLQIHENKAGVLTNNPPFEQQMAMLNNYMGLSPRDPQNTFAEGLELTRYSRGMGAVGLPGDLSSARSAPANTSGPSTPPAGTPRPEFTTTRPTSTAVSAPWTCTAPTLTARS